MIKFVKSLAATSWTTAAAIVVVGGAAVATVISGFGLRISGGLALFFIIWWTLLFAVLPFGIRSQVEAGQVIEGSEPGAPAAPGLREKAIWTTLVAAVVLVAAAALFPLAGL